MDKRLHQAWEGAGTKSQVLLSAPILYNLTQSVICHHLCPWRVHEEKLQGSIAIFMEYHFIAVSLILRSSTGLGPLGR